MPEKPNKTMKAGNGSCSMMSRAREGMYSEQHTIVMGLEPNRSVRRPESGEKIAAGTATAK